MATHGELLKTNAATIFKESDGIPFYLPKND
jgi:hypothetical protein